MEKVIKEVVIGFVATNFNSSAHTWKMIESLALLQEFPTFKIVIVDNCSNAENVDQLNQLDDQYTNVTIIHNENNVGYFRGLNIGINYIRKYLQEVNVMVIGNNDLLFPIDFATSVKNIIPQLNTYPVISPKIFTENGLSQNPHVIEKISFFREVVYDIYFSSYICARLVKWGAKVTKGLTDRSDELKHDEAALIYQGHGSCYLLGSVFFENFQELFAPTFLMGEEFFLSHQLSSKGFKVYYEPRVHLVHNCHSSIDQIPSKKIWEFAREAHKEYRKYIKFSNLFRP
jgi:GT2 family glycosyltransferase